MPKFAANLTMLFTELPFLDRFQAAAKDGFSAVEFLLPYDCPKHQITGLLRAHNLQPVLRNLPSGSWDAGEPASTALAGLSWLRPHGIGT